MGVGRLEGRGLGRENPGVELASIGEDPTPRADHGNPKFQPQGLVWLSHSDTGASHQVIQAHPRPQHEGRAGWSKSQQPKKNHFDGDWPTDGLSPPNSKGDGCLGVVVRMDQSQRDSISMGKLAKPTRCCREGRGFGAAYN